MGVKAVRARVPALHGLVHRHDCAGDCCNYDQLTDALATGDDIYSSDVEIPAGRGLRRYKHLVPGALRTAGREVESQSRVHAQGVDDTGCDRGLPAPTTSPDGVADCDAYLSGAPASLLHTPAGASTSSDVSDARRSPGVA